MNDDRHRRRIRPSGVAGLMAVFMTVLLAPRPEAVQATGQRRPNIIYILLDDDGFADTAPYGSEIHTPNISRLAAEGIRYNMFENRALCSPTRATLLTGRNSFTVGMAGLATSDLHVPHTRGFINPAAGTVAQILKDGGYHTIAVGKWHLIPAAQQPDSYPDRTNWPTGKGFEDFYGWLIGWTDQWNPTGVGREMILGDHPDPTPRPPNYHVSEAIVTHAIDFMQKGFATHPDQPQFLYLAFGATHYAVQAPKAYIDKYKDVYEVGWDRIREQRFARQKQLGIIPADAVLTPRDPSIPAWDSLTETQKTVYARYMADYAGFLEHADVQIGRLVDYLKASGHYDDTVIFFMADNGPTTEGGPNGRFSLQRDVTTVDQMLARIDDIGGPASSPTYPAGWATASATPFMKWKSTPYGGGVRAPLIVTWPGVVRDTKTVRTQFVEMEDITPTALDIAGVTPPATIDGVPQMAMAGRSIRATFTDPHAKTRDTQIFMLGTSRALRHDGWKAVATHTPKTSFDDDVWQLYHSAVDYSEAKDVAAEFPGKLKELKALWQSQAEQYGALPLLERPGGRGRGRPAGPGGAAGRVGSIGGQDPYDTYAETREILMSLADPAGGPMQ
jgi:arylsulfatase